MCIFCKIINNEIPSVKVFENEKILAFRDINQQAPVHIVLIPKEHYETILDIPDDSGIMEEILKAVKTISKSEKIDKSGFRIVNNCGVDGGQTVNHVHFHILGKRELQWPPG